MHKTQCPCCQGQMLEKNQSLGTDDQKSSVNDGFLVCNFCQLEIHRAVAKSATASGITAASHVKALEARVIAGQKAADILEKIRLSTGPASSVA